MAMEKKKLFPGDIFLLTPPFRVDFQLPRLMTPEGHEDQGKQIPVATLGRNSNVSAARLLVTCHLPTAAPQCPSLRLRPAGKS